jgi:predicted transcriptional regulator
MIYRAEKEKGNFVQIHKDLINDHTLSPQAKGIMLYLLSQPDDWQFYETEIAKHFNCGVKGISKIMKELIESGYVERDKIKNRIDGRFSYPYEIYETRKVKEQILDDE